MRRPSRVGAAMAVVLAAASGCSLLLPLDGLDGNDASTGDDGRIEPGGDTGLESGVEASVEAGADSTVEAGVEGGVVDAAAESTATEAGEAGEAGVVDAPAEGTGSTDAADASDALDAAHEAEAEASAPYCASLSPKPTLCEDFDEGAAFNSQFTQTFTAVPANLGADGALFKSPPDSLFSKINSGAASNNAYEYMEKVFTGASTRVDYGFDLLLSQTVTGHEAVTAMVVVNEGLASEHDLGLVLGNLHTMEQSFTTADAGMLFLDTSLAAFPVTGTWSRVDIVVSLAQRTMTVTVDGAAALTAAPLDPSWPTSGAVTVRIGISFANDTTTPWVVRYDDVTVGVQ